MENAGIGDFGNKMEVSYSSSNVTIQDGLTCIRGRFIEEDSSTTLSAGTDNAFCKLVLEIDLSKTNTEEQLNQVSYKIVKSTNDYPQLTQTDIVKNKTGIYQYELARFKTSANGITDFQDMRTFIDFNSIYTAIETEYRAVLEELRAELAAVENGSAYIMQNRFEFLEVKHESNSNAKKDIVIPYPYGFDKDNTCIVSAKVKQYFILAWSDLTTDTWDCWISLADNGLVIHNAESDCDFQITIFSVPAG